MLLGVGVMSVAAGKGRRLPLLSMLCYTCVELALGLLNGCILFDVSGQYPITHLTIF